MVCKSTLVGKNSNLNASKLGGSGVITPWKSHKHSTYEILFIKAKPSKGFKDDNGVMKPFFEKGKTYSTAKIDSVAM